MKPRAVHIVTKGDTHFVMYKSRKAGQRYGAPGFYAKDFTLAQVREWVKWQPKLKLEE